MLLTELKSKLKMEDGSLCIRHNEVEFDELNHILKNLPDEAIRITNALIELEEANTPKRLCISGELQDKWELAGLEASKYAFDKVDIRITEDGADKLTPDIFIAGVVIIGNETVKASGRLDKDGLVTITTDLSNNSTMDLSEFYSFTSGNASSSPIPRNIEALKRFSIKEFEFKAGLKEKTLKIKAKLEGKLDWQIVSSPAAINIESLNAWFDAEYGKNEEGKKKLKLDFGVEGKLALAVGGVNEQFKVKLDFKTDGKPVLSFNPQNEKGLPPLNVLTGIVGGQALTDEVIGVLEEIHIKELNITKVDIAFDLSKLSISNVAIGSRVTIGGIPIDTEIKLPEFSMKGGYNKSEALLSIKAATFLSNLNLSAYDLPELDINSIIFDVEPKGKTYGLEVDLAGHWAFDDKIKLEDLKLSVNYVKKDLSCEVKGVFKLFGNLEIDLYAKHSKTKNTWGLSGKTVPEQKISLDMLAQEILNSFNVTLPFALPEISVKNIDTGIDTEKGRISLSFELTEFSLRKLNIADIPVLDNITVEDVVLKLEINKGKPVKGNIKGTIVIDNTGFEIEFSRSGDGIDFTGYVKNAAIDFREIGNKLAPNLPELVSTMPKIELSKIGVEYHSMSRAFSFTACIEKGISYDINIGVLDKIELKDVMFVMVANKEQKSAVLTSKLQIGRSAVFDISVELSGKGFAFKCVLEKDVSIYLPEMTKFLLGDGVGATFELVPERYRNIILTDLSLIIDTGSGIASFDACTKDLGGVEFAIQKSKEGVLGFVAAIIPPSSFPFSMIHKDLEILDGIDISGSCLIISSLEQPILTLEKLTGTVNDTKIVQGLNVFASMNFKKTNENLQGKAGEISRIAKELGNLVQIDQLTIHGAIGFDLANMLIEGYIGRFSIYDSSFAIENAGLRLSADGNFAIYGTLSMDFEWLTGIPPMCFTGVLKIEANGLELSAFWTGDFGTVQLKKLAEASQDITKLLPKETLQQVMGLAGKDIVRSLPANTLSDLGSAGEEVLGQLALIGKAGEKILDVLPGIQLKEIGVILGCDWEGVPTGGCVGRFTVDGDKPENEGLVAFLFNSNNPTQSILQVKLPRDAEQSIIRFLDKCSGLTGSHKKLPDWTSLIEVNGYEIDGKWVPLQLKIVPLNVMIGNTMYKKGIIMQGRVVIFKFIDVILNIMIDGEAGVKAFGQMKPVCIDCSGTRVLEISKAEKSLRPAENILNENMASVSTVYDGPFFDLNIPLSPSGNNLPYLKFNGKLKMLGIEVFKTDCEISKDRISFYLQESNGILQYNLSCCINGQKELQASGSISCGLSFNIITPALEFFPASVIRVEDRFSGEITIFAGLTQCIITVEGSFYIKDPFTNQSVSVELPKITYSVPKLIVDLGKELAAQIEECMKKAVEAAAWVVDNLVKPVLHEIEKATKEIIKLIQESEAFQQLKRELEADISKIKEGIKILEDVIGQLEEQSNNFIEKTRELAGQIIKAENDAVQASYNLAKSIEGCTLGTTEYYILKAVSDAEAAYNNQEKERIKFYKERLKFFPPFNLLPSAKESAAAIAAETAKDAAMLARIAAFPVIEARKTANQTIGLLDSLRKENQNLLDILQKIKDEKAQKEKEKIEKEAQIKEANRKLQEILLKWQTNTSQKKEADERKKTLDEKKELIKSGYAKEIGKQFKNIVDKC